jgi:predicted phage terminase large subunit-like protein
MNAIQKKILKQLRDNPVALAHELGFTKLKKKLHNKWIQDMVYGKGDDTLQAHRGSYKTTCVSIAFLLIIILYPNDTTMFMRKTDDDVKEIIAQVKKMIKNPFTIYLVRMLYGCDFYLTKESAYELSTNLANGPRGTCQLTAKGMNTSITGKHYDRIFTDDIVNISDRFSKKEREHTKRIYDELQNIKIETGRIFNTGTPWHKDDAFTKMPKPKKYDCYTTGLLTDEEIQYKKDHMDLSLFSANYELKHRADSDVIFEPKKERADISAVMNGLAHVDSAFYGEDYTALTVMQKHDGKYYVFGKIWRKHVEDCYDDIKRWYDYLLVSKLYNEKNADKGLVAKAMRKTYGMKVVTYHEDMNKHIKITTCLKAIWKEVVIVEGTDEEYIKQIEDYTENAEHDDAPDSCSCLARIMKKKK